MSASRSYENHIGLSTSALRDITPSLNSVCPRTFPPKLKFPDSTSQRTPKFNNFFRPNYIKEIEFIAKF